MIIEINPSTEINLSDPAHPSSPSGLLRTNASAHPRGGGLLAKLLKPGRAVAGRPRRPVRGPLRSSAPGHGDSETLELTRAAMHCRVALARLKLTWARLRGDGRRTRGAAARSRREARRALARGSAGPARRRASVPRLPQLAARWVQPRLTRMCGYANRLAQNTWVDTPLTRMRFW